MMKRLSVLLLACGLSGQLAAQYEMTGQPPQGSGVGDATMTVADPQSRAKIHTELGALYFQAGSAAIALEHLAMALQIDSRHYPANSVRGLVYASLREYGKAESDFARALSLAPNDPEVNNNYGWFLCDTGKERQSIQYFERALRDPLYETPDRAYTNAGNCLLKAGDLDQAQSYEPVPPAVDNTASEADDRQKRLALYAWLVEWSQIARTVIRRRDLLIQLGLAKPKARKKGDEG